MPPWTVEESEGAVRLAAFVRSRAGGEPWARVKQWIGTGKVFVDGRVETNPGALLAPGRVVEVRQAAPRPRDPSVSVRIVHDDSQLVVIDKPAGISSVPYEPKEKGTAMDLVRDAWRRMDKGGSHLPLHVVHRIDKATSGLLVFAKSKSAERGLGLQFRDHSIDRLYLCVAHGQVTPGRIESLIARDRGDGLRGASKSGQGKRAVTHVAVRQALRRATLCEVRLETGKTHQIRIHLSERGHPLVGEQVYTRDYLARGGSVIDSPRLLLHAAELGFVHPSTGERLMFESALPPDFTAVLRTL
jgi:23S rRNA pseudouridine1911/1915/1917 synthase